MISLSYIKLHPELVEKKEITTVRMWCYPWLGWFTVVGFIGLTALMLSDDSSRSQITSVAVVFTTLVILSFLTRKKSK